ncbi:LacI family transcriptional regulator [Streptococcus chenjunshii]|uniref:LacI family transcriptional regulator n=1 Tax=Streptococcus chenjunshii TaxID=2173853 RepID=A0A372KQB2_9STRE|nr:LacI family DNA-binding transcriptional regulator [Streptococcus chenjunshii]AXQ77788.1 LacI family transcriptional regulator [Streptococcus chenjunshii]RFU51298.1 LacI family transcriptional regulator [Streptococcus chenjunshii]RFU53828.1 LacI family transcriptional regulator [Streptococcus chenjunshii]
MATIKDVAKLAGVSASTASRALHDSSMISEATKERVRQAMAELDYSPNYSAQNLVNRQSNTIGIVLPVRESQESLGNNPFFMQIIQGISSVCSENNYMVSLASGRTDEELKKNIETLIRSGNIRRIIFLYSKKGDPVFQYVKKQKNIACVVVGEAYEKSAVGIQYVDNNNIQAGKDAADFLINKGYRKIIFASTDMDELVQAQRYQGYCQSLAEHSLEGKNLTLSRIDSQGNTQHLQALLAEHPGIQAFVACDDIMAIRLQRLFKEMGVSADDYAILGFNNSWVTEIASPALTSVDIFPYELGEKAAGQLLQTAKQDGRSAAVIIPHRIIERESTPKLEQ